jgi:inhibitor of KinA
MIHRIVRAGDSAFVVEFEARIDPTVNAQAIALAEAVHAAGVAGVRDVVPTYRSVAIHFDPLRTNIDALTEHIERSLSSADSTPGVTRPPIPIPVCYGGELGPDLPAVAAFARCSEAAVIHTHAATTYRVFMLGFVPGFAYLGIVDERIAMPRHPVPRVRVPARSVAIAGVQTGIYPTETPGGWQIIGRTPLEPFDPNRPEPFLMKAGDSVQFYPIERAEYDRVSKSATTEGTAPNGGDGKLK